MRGGRRRFATTVGPVLPNECRLSAGCRPCHPTLGLLFALHRVVLVETAAEPGSHCHRSTGQGPKKRRRTVRERVKRGLVQGRQRKEGGEERAWRPHAGSVGCIQTAHIYSCFVLFYQRANNGTAG